MHGHFRHVAIVVGIRLGGVAVDILAVGLEGRLRAGDRRVRLVLFAGQVGAPGRPAGATGDPQAMHRRRVDVAVFHQAELAGVRVLRQGQHGDRRRQQAIHVVAGLIHRLVFELHHGVDRVASDAGNLRRLRQRQQRRANGPLDEIGRDAHFALPAAAGADAAASSRTLLPGFSLYCPSTTTRCPTLRPSWMTATPSCIRSTFTARGCATLSPSTAYT
ncbi:hypothetical protein G6F65_017628 [Rhizopus arrhizus]|nr:hypothetical protein G6F65_017628 [Rhizopus arrhizus]